MRPVSQRRIEPQAASARRPWGRVLSAVGNSAMMGGMTTNVHHMTPPQVVAEAALCRQRLVILLNMLPLGHPSRPPLLAALAAVRSIIVEKGR